MDELTAAHWLSKHTHNNCKTNAPTQKKFCDKVPVQDLQQGDAVVD
jgi:hypothetical protein